MITPLGTGTITLPLDVELKGSSAVSFRAQLLSSMNRRGYAIQSSGILYIRYYSV